MRKSLFAATALVAAGAGLALPMPAAHAAAAPILFVTVPASPWQGWYAESVDVHVVASGGLPLPLPPNLKSLTYRMSGASSGNGTLPFEGGTGSGDVHVTTPGLTQVTVTAVNTKNETTEVTQTVGVDGQVPRVIFQGKLGTEHPVFEKGEEAYFHYACTDDFTGVKICDGPDQGSRIDTTTLGTHEVGVASADNVGNGALTLLDYEVVAQAPKELHFTGAPAVAGPATVGQRLTATAPGVAGPTGPVAATLGYLWKRDGVAVPGATGASYGLGPADAGHAISVTVTGSAAGYKSAEASSQGVAVAAAQPTLQATIKAKGKRKVTITVQVSAPGLDTSGPITISRGGKVVGRGTVQGGKAVITLKKQPVKKKVTYVVSYGGGAGVAPAQVTVSGRVR